MTSRGRKPVSADFRLKLARPIDRHPVEGFVERNRESGNSEPVMVTAADFANLSLLGPYTPLQALLKTARVVTSDEMPRDVGECLSRLEWGTFVAA